MRWMIDRGRRAERRLADTLRGMASVVYSRIGEHELRPEDRVQLASLLLPRWLARPGVRERAWTQREPLARIVASLDRLIGQAAVCLLRPSDPCVLGIGDLVVASDFRRRGVGSTLVREAVGLAGGQGADVIVVASRDPTVRRVSEVLGFRPCRPHELIFRQGDLLSWNETWLIRGADGLDLVEIAGDV